MPAPADQAVQELFKQHFGFRPPHLTRAPAVIELLGCLAEEQAGLSLAVTADRHAFVAAAPRTDGRVELVHADRAPEVFWISNLQPSPAAPWADGAKAVLQSLRTQKVHFSGFNAALHGDIPPGLGLGESAAAAVALALTVRKLFPFGLGDSGATVPPKRGERGELPPLPPTGRLHFARVCRAGGGGWVATLTALAGRAWTALNLDARFQSVEPAPLIGTAVIVASVEGGTSEAPASRLTELPALCRGAARKLGAQSLRSVETKFLRQWESRLSAAEFAAALHVCGENQRAAAAERALREEDHAQLGQYLTLSHASLRALDASTPDADVLVELAGTLRGCLGARALAPGVRATVNLVAYHEAEPFLAQLTAAFATRTGQRLRTFVCPIVDGAQ